MDVNIISTGSKGNAVVLNGIILIDCGVPFKKLQAVKKDLKLVLLTHVHSDHFIPSTVRALHRERPGLRFCCCKWMVKPLLEAGVSASVIDVVEYTTPGSTSKALCYNGIAIVTPFPLIHCNADGSPCPNCGWEIYHGQENCLYATDTGSMDGVTAQNFDLYLIEGNHKEAELEARVAAKEAACMYAYERRAAVAHLSEEQALAWLADNAGPNSRYIFMHRHEEKD